jgi:hypothetical protein
VRQTASINILEKSVLRTGDRAIVVSWSCLPYTFHFLKPFSLFKKGIWICKDTWISYHWKQIGKW